jgi:hypothetical protein
MQRYRDQGFVVADDLEFQHVGASLIMLRGRIDCTHGLYIEVTKALRIVSGTGAEAMVQTISYSYNAVLSGIGNVFRYDSPHEDHNRDHHVHRYDVFAGDARGATTFHGEDGWPTLGEAIEKLRCWVSDHAEQLETSQRGDE